jgi:hypothetical protein
VSDRTLSIAERIEIWEEVRQLITETPNSYLCNILRGVIYRRNLTGNRYSVTAHEILQRFKPPNAHPNLGWWPDSDRQSRIDVVTAILAELREELQTESKTTSAKESATGPWVVYQQDSSIATLYDTKSKAEEAAWRRLALYSGPPQFIGRIVPLFEVSQVDTPQIVVKALDGVTTNG